MTKPDTLKNVCQNVYQNVRKLQRENKLTCREISALRQKNLYKKAGNECFDCGRSTIEDVRFVFHHVDPSTKEFQICQWWTDLRTDWEKVLTEYEKCVFLCTPCHVIRHTILRRMGEPKAKRSGDMNKKSGRPSAVGKPRSKLLTIRVLQEERDKINSCFGTNKARTLLLGQSDLIIAFNSGEIDKNEYDLKSVELAEKMCLQN